MAICGMEGGDIAEQGIWKQAMWKGMDAPLDWWFYPCFLVVITGLNLWEQGPSLASLRGGVVISVFGLTVFCTVRRYIVGHWR